MIGRHLLRVLPLVLGGCVIEYVVPAAEGTGADGTATDSEGPGTTDGDPCPPGRQRCGAVCIDLASDPDHCGDCGRACAASDVCDLGECVAACGEGRDECSRACVDFQTDPFHCGSCSEVCEIGGECVAADCKDTCGDACDDVLEVCVSAECQCRPGLVRCGSTCVDLQTDPDHCGECDRACDGQPCGGGDCLLDCSAFPDQCGSSCTDLASDPLHCGECDNPCDGDEICATGDCDDLD